MTGVSVDADESRSGSSCRPGSSPSTTRPVTVTITVRPVTATRTFEAGLRLVGASPDLDLRARRPTASLVTVGGSTADLDRLTGATLVVDLDVTGLEAGDHEVPGDGRPAGRDDARRGDPSTVTVTITAEPSPRRRPIAGPAPSPAEPGG